MKGLLLAALILLTACSGFAQSGQIGVYSDTGGTTEALDNTTGYMQAYCVHVNSSGATACQFAVNIVGDPLTYFGESSQFNVLGDALNGIAIAYGQCKTSPIHVLTITLGGTSTACDRIEVVAYPSASPPGVYVTDCASPVPNLLAASGGGATINPDDSCPGKQTGDSSWGRIKSIYR